VLAKKGDGEDSFAPRLVGVLFSVTAVKESFGRGERQGACDRHKTNVFQKSIQTPLRSRPRTGTHGGDRVRSEIAILPRRQMGSNRLPASSDLAIWRIMSCFCAATK
jgi:hypothetical protein